MTTFAGRQVRYLVGSAHGWLGAAGFSAAALRVAARERWIGWDDEGRRAHLDRVVCLSRFLIRPSVHCPHLASHVLGRILRRLPGDFEQRYGYRPYLVESFADEGYDGTCLRAANFLRIGTTEGRGRQDREHRRAKSVKTVLVRELERSWRTKLGVAHVDHAPSLHPGEGLNAQDWAENEFGGAPLGDKRLSARLVKSAGLLAAYPGQKINASSDSAGNEIAGFYRLVEAPAQSEITVANILAPHRERTIGRMRGQRTVLAIQDGTDLNFSRRPGCEGLQLVGKNQTGATSLGLHLHATLVVTGRACRSECSGWASTHRPSSRKSRTSVARPSAGSTDSTISPTPCARSAARRGCSAYATGRRTCSSCSTRSAVARVWSLWRAPSMTGCSQRGKPKLFAVMSAGDPDALIDVEIEGLTARPKSSRKKARAARQKRLASCELRFRRVTLPATHAVPGAEPVSLYAVHVREVAPPEGEEPVQWFLLSTVEVRTARDAADIVGFYLQRWRIEDWFRILKSGCRVEFLLFRTAERLQRAIAINAVIAWRIMVMTLLGRQVPECEPQLMFTDQELAFLRDYATRYALQAPERLGDAVRLVAHLGGYRDRKHDPDPGNQIMWHGQTRLTSAALGHEIGFQAGQKHILRARE